MTSTIKVILVRHGQSTSTMENPQRPLAIAGRQHAEHSSSWLAGRAYDIDEIIHSTKLRARQTAKIFGSRLAIHSGRVREREGLKPHDDPAPIAEGLETDGRSIMIVSHLPFLNRLASLMLVGDPDRLQFQFSDAGVVVLSRVGTGWRIEAVVGHQMV